MHKCLLNINTLARYAFIIALMALQTGCPGKGDGAVCPPGHEPISVDLTGDVSSDGVGDVVAYETLFPESITPRPDLDTFFDELRETRGYVGLAAAVYDSGNITYLKGFGYSNHSPPTPVAPRQTIFRLASVSKGLVGVITAMLVEDGLINPSDRAKDLWPDMERPTHLLSRDDPSGKVPLSASERDFTLQQLLTHTAGIQHYSNGIADPTPSGDETGNPTINTGMKWAVERLLRDHPLIAPPGTVYKYSSFGYNIAGVLLEEITGESLRELVRTRISTAASLNTLDADVSWESTPHKTKGYSRSGAQTCTFEDNVSWKLAGGGFMASAKDLATYCGALVSNHLMLETTREKVLLRPGTPRPIPEDGGSEYDYALGFILTSSGFVHTGVHSTARAIIRGDTTRDQCFVILVNSGWGEHFGAISRDFRNLYRAPTP